MVDKYMDFFGKFIHNFYFIFYFEILKLEMSFKIELRSTFYSFLDHGSGNGLATHLESLMMTSVELCLSWIHWETEGKSSLSKNKWNKNFDHE